MIEIDGFYDNPEYNAKLKTILEKKEEEETAADAELSRKPYFFKNVLFFTNERKASKNKTLKNLEEAIEGRDINLVVFVADEVSFKATDDSIVIKDFKTEYTVDEQSNIDTIVIARLGVQESEECMECIKELQAWGLFVLNPIASAKKASNKYTTAVLLERYGVPQPKFILVQKNDVANNMDSLNEKLKEIYPDIKESPDADSYQYVIKILSGHGGSGVSMCTGKNILSVLQLIFAVDEDQQILIQNKVDIDGGDIRVHVYTGRTKQVIMAAMKRKKLGKDFRSNVSLGAEAEPIELTEEQKEIALKVARISGMAWCAADIAPLIKDSNKELGNNVVLEFNASPGTDGISDVIHKNFISVLFDTINDINELRLEPKSIGYRENVEFTIGKDKLTMEAKLDTGNGSYSSTIGCDSIEEQGNKIKAVIMGNEYTFRKHGVSKPKVGQVREERTTVIIDEIKLGTRRLLNVEFALVDNRDKSTKVLLNRDVMSKMGYIINPSRQHTLDLSEFDIVK